MLNVTYPATCYASLVQVGACCAKCHLSGDLLCESCRWVHAVLNVTYPVTCCASLVGGCMLC